MGLRPRPAPDTLAVMSKETSPTGRPGLVRALGPLMAMAVVVGTTIGSGVFKKAQVVAGNVPDLGTTALAWVSVGVRAIRLSREREG